MNMEIFKAVLAFAGGLGLFIYGMEVMGEGLSSAAGSRTKKLLEVLTRNRFMAVCAGALVTAIIQSSSALTVMVVGFVNASLMSLTQAAGVIMGANIGTTMTAWIVSMGEWAAFLKPEMIAPVMLMGGVGVSLFSHSPRVRSAARIFIGFGMLFTGLSTMSGAIKPYTDAPIFSEAFTLLGNNPLLGILAGAVVTAVIQSSSASMGILQTLAAAGAVNWGSAVFIALGQNIGTCVTALLSSVSGDDNAKRAAMIHLEFNVIGALLAAIAFWVYFLVNPAMMQAGVDATSLAVFHTCFNVAVTVVLFPFAKQLVDLSRLLVPEHDRAEGKGKDRTLDSRLLRMPQAALKAVHQELVSVTEDCIAMLEQTRKVLTEQASDEALLETGEKVMKSCRQVRDYLGQMEQDALSAPEQKRIQKNLLRARDLLQISVSCVRIARLTSTAEPVQLSPEARQTIDEMTDLCIRGLQGIYHEHQKDGQQEDPYACARQVYLMEQAFSDQNALAQAARNRTLPEAWLLMEASEGYLQIARRTVRLDDENSWRNPGLLSLQMP